jgi:hypothetical protein
MLDILQKTYLKTVQKSQSSRIATPVSVMSGGIMVKIYTGVFQEDLTKLRKNLIRITETSNSLKLALKWIKKGSILKRIGMFDSWDDEMVSKNWGILILVFNL